MTISPQVAHAIESAPRLLLAARLRGSYICREANLPAFHDPEIAKTQWITVKT
jgi:hypothetical protein